MSGSPAAGAEEQVLGLLRQLECHPEDWATGGPAVADRDGLERHGRLLYGAGKLDWDAALEGLEAAGSIRRRGVAFELTEPSRRRAEGLRKAHLAAGFGELQVRCASSSVYQEFCRRVFGPDLAPFSLLERRQLDVLVENLAAYRRPRVLDLGCGTGAVTAALQRSTGGAFTGVDLAPAAVEHGRGAVAGAELRFEVADLDHWTPPAGAFDAIVGIDVLYFLDDLATTLPRLQAGLAPGGRMLFLCSELADGPKDASLPRASRLSRALESLAIPFETVDLSASEVRLWQRQSEAAAALQGDFAAEGNAELGEMLLREAERGAGRARQGRVRRYLYATLTPERAAASGPPAATPGEIGAGRREAADSR